jgi:hypothetical protein
MNTLLKPLTVTKDKVTLSRATWNALMEALEDAKDRASVDAYLTRRAEGEDDGLPVALYDRLVAGEHPVRIWREQRKLGLNALAAKAGVAPAYLSEIENRKKPGSVAALQRLAKALNVGLDDLVRPPNDRAKPAKKRRSARR